MHFKRLELFGFKSFAERTKLDFESGVTAIVGPNGCGKSNISDAIKWVLGEQSAYSLRGAKMEDLIFHGADGIDPIGMAEVSLTISNQAKLLPVDYEELALTRRIFRSGESEYLINKIPVRLKDIQELLMGTGLGMRSYSLMEQGKVDQILNSRPEERREIFEEASGITRYKTKKEEALRKLERTQENLQRIGDIIVEVRRQLKSIERQVHKAHRYKEEFEKLKEYELKVAQYQYQNFKKEKELLEQQAEDWRRQEAVLDSQMNAVVQSLEKTKQDLCAVEENLAQIQAQGYEVSATIRTAEEKTNLNQERIGELAKRSIDLQKEIEGLAKRSCATQEQLEEAQLKIETLEQEKQEKLSFIPEREKVINDILDSIKQTQKKISEDKAEELEVITQKTRLKNELTKLEANLANFYARQRRLNIEVEKTTEELNNIEEKQQRICAELDLVNEQLKNFTREVWDLKSSLNIKLEKKEELDSRLEELTHQSTAQKSALNFLQEIIQKYEGFSGGAKSILSAIDSQALKIEGVCDVVANLLQVAPQYQIAVEMALGETAQAIVVENSRAALEALNYLKQEARGRASFICLDTLKDNEREIKPKGALASAQDLVKTELKYQKLVKHLLVNTFIVQDLETASQMVKLLSPSARLVTLNGEIITRTSIIGGMAAGDFAAALLGRQEKVAQGQQKLEKLIKEKSELESLKASRELEIKEITNVIQEKEPSLNKLKIELANKESERASVEAAKKRFQDELAVLKLEIEETENEIQRLHSDQKQLNQKLANQEKRQKELQEMIQGQQEIIVNKNQEKQNILVEIAEAKAKCSSLDRESEGVRKRLAMIQEAQAEQELTKETREEELKDTTCKIEQLKQQIEQLKLQNGELAQKKFNLEEKLNHALAQRQRFSDAIGDLEAKVKENQKALDETRAKRASFQLKLTELNYKQDSLKDKMHQSYHLDLESTLAASLEVLAPEDTLFAEINELRVRLEGMGPVNLVAIEENEQLEQRYSFLIAQQEDLVKAEESLRKAITQINYTARKMFAETFEKIQASFKEYFRILFGGGETRLVLLDEDNILESGVEIVVRPPGKRLQNISLLSGGEKALTAIALLFSVFKVKPSPFCILDEVDAPLDEANIDRFTRLLSEFIQTSQFIIITHNKKTINMADIMYGITMEKTGISKIVSVRLSEAKEVTSPEEVAQIER